jgi:hypothetical protein
MKTFTYMNVKECFHSANSVKTLTRKYHLLVRHPLRHPIQGPPTADLRYNNRLCSLGPNIQNQLLCCNQCHSTGIASYIFRSSSRSHSSAACCVTSRSSWIYHIIICYAMLGMRHLSWSYDENLSVTTGGQCDEYDNPNWCNKSHKLPPSDLFLNIWLWLQVYHWTCNLLSEVVKWDITEGGGFPAIPGVFTALAPRNYSLTYWYR